MSLKIEDVQDALAELKSNPEWHRCNRCGRIAKLTHEFLCRQCDVDYKLALLTLIGDDRP